MRAFELCQLSSPSVAIATSPLAKNSRRLRKYAARTRVRHGTYGHNSHSVYRAIELDATAGRIKLAGGESLPFNSLVIATGSRARHLTIPGHDRDGIVYLRSLDDALTLKSRLEAASDVVIVGGGFIGLEVASTAAKAGKKVTLIEAQSRLMERSVSPLISQFLCDIHHANGVETCFNESVVAIEGIGAVHEVVTSSGLRVRADLVVAGIGGIVNDALAVQAGIVSAHGIDVDEHGRTSAPNIYAAGDVSNHHSSFAGRRVRLEAVQNATDQGKAAGAMIAGKPEAYHAVPRFWSDRFDAKLQIVGLSAPTDRAVVRGDMQDGKFSVFHFRDKKLTAVDSINKPGDQMIARRLITASLSPTPEQAADLACDLRTCEAGRCVRSMNDWQCDMSARRWIAGVFAKDAIDRCEASHLQQGSALIFLI